MMKIKKKYQYKIVLIDDRGHLDDPVFISMLNENGALGWKRSEEAPKGSKQLAVLLEREVILDGEGEEVS